MGDDRSDNPAIVPSARGRDWSRRWWPGVAVTALYLLIAVPLIVFQHDRERGRADQVTYHQPCVLKLAEELPRPDFSEYLTATTPAYHLYLAVVARFVSDSTVVLQLAGAVFTVLLLAVFAGWLAPRTGPLTAGVIALTLLASPYVFSAGVFILPDNAAWLMVMLILVLANRFKTGPWFYVVSGVAFACLVMTRQSHAWVAAVVWAAAWIGPRSDPFADDPGQIGVRALTSDLPARIRRAVLAFVATLPGLLLVAWFYRMWGGFTPRIYQGYMQGVNPATPAFIALELGLVALFYVGFWGPPLVRVARRRPLLIASIVIGAVLFAAIPETTFSPEDGRRTGVWGLVKAGPVVAGRTSVVMLLGVPLGALAVTGWGAAMPKRSRWLIVGALVAFTAAMSSTINAWSRYHLPMLLIVAGVSTAMVAGRRRAMGAVDSVRTGTAVDRAIVVARRLGPVGLVVVLGAVTFRMNTTGPRHAISLDHPGAIRPLPDLWPSEWKANGPPADLTGPDGVEAMMERVRAMGVGPPADR